MWKVWGGLPCEHGIALMVRSTWSWWCLAIEGHQWNGPRAREDVFAWKLLHTIILPRCSVYSQVAPCLMYWLARNRLWQIELRYHSLTNAPFVKCVCKYYGICGSGNSKRANPMLRSTCMRGKLCIFQPAPLSPRTLSAAHTLCLEVLVLHFQLTLAYSCRFVHALVEVRRSGLRWKVAGFWGMSAGYSRQL